MEMKEGNISFLLPPSQMVNCMSSKHKQVTRGGLKAQRSLWRAVSTPSMWPRLSSFLNFLHLDDTNSFDGFQFNHKIHSFPLFSV